MVLDFWKKVFWSLRNIESGGIKELDLESKRGEKELHFDIYVVAIGWVLEFVDFALILVEFWNAWIG